MVRLISRQRGVLVALKLTKLFGINDFPAAKDSGKVLIIITILLFNCLRAIARQHTILYNRAKSAKSVGCNIGDMRSRLRFLYPGIPGCL